MPVPVPGRDQEGAGEPVERARGADPQAGGGQGEGGGERPGHATREVEGEEAQPAVERLGDGAEGEQGDRIAGDVGEAAVDKGGGHQAPQLAVVEDRDGAEAEQDSRARRAAPRGALGGEDHPEGGREEDRDHGEDASRPLPVGGPQRRRPSGRWVGASIISTGSIPFSGSQNRRFFCNKVNAVIAIAKQTDFLNQF